MKENKISKAKTKAKEKTAAKIAKAGKSAGKTAAKAATVLALIVAVAGCASTGEQPARSQTMHNDFRDCVIIANARSVALDTKAKTLDADADTMSAPLELWTQTQANEGSETIAPVAKPTNTTDVDAALDVPVNKANTGGTSAAGGGALEKVFGAGADWLSDKITGKGTDADATAAKGADTSATCPNGNCGTGQCSGGNCSDTDCEDCKVK